MRPIGSIRLGGYHRLDVQFSGYGPIGNKDFSKALHNLDNDGLIVIDTKKHNFCYSSVKTAEFPYGIPVILDPNSVHLKSISSTATHIRNLSGRKNGIQKFLSKTPFSKPPSRILDLSPKRGEEPDGQDIAYADLREKFNNMFDRKKCAATLVVDPDAVQDFWKAMIQATQESRLKASWLNKGNKVALAKGVDKVSMQYDQRLQEHNPVFALN
jgi:hypothetical protein